MNVCSNWQNNFIALDLMFTYVTLTLSNVFKINLHHRSISQGTLSGQMVAYDAGCFFSDILSNDVLVTVYY